MTDGWVDRFYFVSTLSYKLITHIVYFLAFTAKFHQGTPSLNTMFFCRQQSPNLINESWCNIFILQASGRYDPTKKGSSRRWFYIWYFQTKHGDFDCCFVLNEYRVANKTRWCLPMFRLRCSCGIVASKVVGGGVIRHAQVTLSSLSAAV